MIRTFNNQPLHRFTPKTSKMLFRRIDVPSLQSQGRFSRSSQQQRNLPRMETNKSTKNLFKSVNSLDNSKENLMLSSFLNKVSSANKIDQKSIVSNYLNSLRKDYDKIQIQTRKNLISINIKKKDIDFIKDRLIFQQLSFKSVEQKVQQKIKQLQIIKGKQENVQGQRKTLDFIIQRMKKDQLFYKQFGRIFQNRLNQKKKDLKSLNQNVILEDDKIHKLLIKIDDMAKTFEKNQQLRQKKLEDYCQKLQSIHQKELFIQERNQRTFQIQSIQSNDILKAKNLEMKNICLINKLLNNVFQTKVQRLIQKYANIEKAFHTIQVETSIRDPNLIANKFFSYGELTQNLLKSILNYEKQFQQKSKKNQQLKNKLRKLQQSIYNNDTQQFNFENIQKINVKEFKGINKKNIIYNKIVDWIQRQAKKLNILQDFTKQEQSLETFVKKFAQICIQTKTQTQQVAKNLKSFQKFVSPGIRIKKITKENNLDSKNKKAKELAQTYQQSLIEDEYFNSTRIGTRKNFIIKQKTINLGILNDLKQNNTEKIDSDQKLRLSDNS